MRPAARNALVGGAVLFLGTPIVATLLVLLQKPTGGTGAARSVGETVSTVLVANFACLPFMFMGLVLLLVGWVMHRNSGRHPAA
jgi:hypothetical protein